MFKKLFSKNIIDLLPKVRGKYKKNTPGSPSAARLK